MIAEEFQVWSDEMVPVVILNSTPKETKEFQVWNDTMVPFVDIYDTGTTRRRVMEF